MSNKISTLTKLKALSPQFAEKIPYLKLLVLFGSRATGHIHTESDWDFAALYDEEIRRAYMKDAWSWFEIDLILSQVFDIPDTKIDVVELNRCSPLIGYVVARDGKLLYEKHSGSLPNFNAEPGKFMQIQRNFVRLKEKALNYGCKSGAYDNDRT